MPAVGLAVEGVVDEHVLRRLFQETGGRRIISGVYGKKGKDDLRRNIAAYNHAARFSEWIVLVDLDQEEECAPELRARWLPNANPGMTFRVAVRAVEAWLIADREAMARFLKVPLSRIPRDPDAIPDPKRAVVDIARNSRKADVRHDVVPRERSGRSVGVAYTSRMIEFIKEHWRPRFAAETSDSLRRCIRHIENPQRTIR